MKPTRPALLSLSLAGPGNQYCGLKEGLLLASVLERDFVLPVFIPHGTIRRQCRSFYTFEETFDAPFFADGCAQKLGVRVVPFAERQSTLNDPHRTRAVLIRKDEASSRQALEYLSYYRAPLGLALPDDAVTRPPDAQTFLRSHADVRAWSETVCPDPEQSLIVVGLFNSLKLGGIDPDSPGAPCSKNHCLNCQPHPAFQDLYAGINEALRFAPHIRALGDQYIDTHFGDRPFLSFHLRICDLPRHRSFARCYSGHTEETVMTALEAICERHRVDPDDLFLATPPQLFTAVSDLKRFRRSRQRVYANSEVDPHVSAMVEQYICTRAKVFVRSYTNTPDVPRKAHTRSSWAELVEGMRGDRSLNFTIDDEIRRMTGGEPKG